jgi:hypothetical protein
MFVENIYIFIVAYQKKQDKERSCFTAPQKVKGKTTPVTDSKAQKG